MQRALLQIVNRQILQKRYYKKHHVKVRFAPSPTGFLHLGGLRTALYNYLFARANNGTFVLRVEDTDLARVVPGAMEKLHDDLLWAGIIPDEDPIRGGPLGPYQQSKRLDIYKEQVSHLLNNGSAYYCFCTENRLELIKKEAIRCGHVPKYDNRCRQYSKEEVKEKLIKGEEHCIRFKLSPDLNTFNDMIYGSVTHDTAKIEGDPVIIKSDGYPTYHFANVVDDHLMEISHVLRGIEWQISTPKHLMLYEAFGWTPPVYGHLPLLLNASGSKLSKRQRDIMVDTFRTQGIFPQALLNYIISAGGGFIKDEDDQYLSSYEELIKQFTISRIKSNSGKLQPQKLLEYNKKELQRLLSNTKNDKFLIERLKKTVLQAFPDLKSEDSVLSDEILIFIMRWAQTRISCLNDLTTPDFAFLWITPTSQLDPKDSNYIDAIKELYIKLTEMDAGDFIVNKINPSLKEYASNNNSIVYSVLMQHLRMILTDLKCGPSVGEIMEMLGKERTLWRLKRVISSPPIVLENKAEREQETSTA